MLLFLSWFLRCFSPACCVWHKVSVSIHMLVLRHHLCDVLFLLVYTVYPYQRIIHTVNHVLTRHNVTVLQPVQLGRYERKHSVILSETCCQAEEPVCWHQPTHDSISLMWNAAGHKRISDQSEKAGLFPVSHQADVPGYRLTGSLPSILYGIRLC